MVNMGIFNALSKLESQILSYKQDTEFEIPCFVNKARVLLLFKRFVFKFQSMFLSSVDNIIYNYIESVHLACHESFCQRNGNFCTLFANNYETQALFT